MRIERPAVLSIVFLGSVLVACSSDSVPGGGDGSGGPFASRDAGVLPWFAKGEGGAPAASTPGASASEGGAPVPANPGSCTGGLVECPKGCAALESDVHNCGSCGYACPDKGNGTFPVCVKHACVYKCGHVNETLCSESQNAFCVDLKNDPLNCGACDRYCDGPQGGAASCENGTCASGCRGGKTECQGACVDTSSDRMNCGACGNECQDIGKGAPSCVSGKCTYPCGAGEAMCNSTCTNVLGDSQNCGQCGVDCRRFAGSNRVSYCANGSCSQPTCAHQECMGRCCAAGQICLGNGQGGGWHCG